MVSDWTRGDFYVALSIATGIVAILLWQYGLWGFGTRSLEFTGTEPDRRPEELKRFAVVGSLDRRHDQDFDDETGTIDRRRLERHDG